jgi:hypothetical protein
MVAEGNILKNETQAVDAGDDRYLPGYRKGLAEYGPRLVETRVAFSLYGTPIPYTIGKRRLQGNIIYADELEEKEVVTTVNGRTVTNYGYYGTFAISFGYNADSDAGNYVLRRAWADGRLIIDNVNRTRAVAPGIKYTFYPGTETQEPDPTLVARNGADNTPAFRGQIYMVFVDLPLLAFNNKVPAITIEVEDINSLTSSADDMTGVTNENNNGSFFVDWDRMKGYVLNSTERNLYIYDLAAGAYLREQKVTLSGGIGPDQPCLFIPWMRRAFVGEPGLNIHETYRLFNPETGAITASAGGDTLSAQATRYCAGKYTKPSGQTFTLVAYMSVYDDLGFFSVGETGDSMVFLEEIAGGTFDAAAGLAVGGYHDVNNMYVYSGNGSTVSRTAVPKADIEGFASANVGATQDAAWYAYDGAGAPTFIRHIIPYVTPAGVPSLIIFYDNNEVIMIDEETQTVAWRNTSVTNMPSTPTNTFFALQNADTTNQILAWDNLGGNIAELNLSNGAITDFSVTTAFTNTFGVGHGASRSILSQASTGGGMRRVFYQTSSGQNLTLENLIKQLASLSGYDPNTEVDVDASVDQSIIGAMLVETTSLEEILNSLRTIFGLEVVESDGKIKVYDRARGNPSADFIVTDDDIMEISGSASFTWRQEDELALPREFKVTYIEPTLGYQWASQVFSRSNQDSTNFTETTNEIKVPLVMSADDAKRAAARALYTGWSTSTTFGFALNQSFLGVEPGDILDVTVDGYSSQKMKVVEVRYLPDFSVQVSATGFHPWEDLNVTAYPGIEYSPSLDISAEHQVFVFDVLWPERNLSGAEGDRTVTVMMLPPTPTATYPDPGKLFIGDVSGTIRDLGVPESVNALPWGRVTTDCAMTLVNDYETLNDQMAINVDILGGDASLLSSNTYTNVINGANLAAIGKPGQWEIIGFLDVTLEADGSYTFTNIVRGLHKTFPAQRQMAHGVAHLKVSNIFDTAAEGQLRWIGTGREDDYFVLLDSDYVEQVTVSPTEIYFGGADTAGDAPQAMSRTMHFNREAMPLPCHVTRITRDSDGEVTVFYEPTFHNQRTLGDGTDPAFATLPNETGEVLMDLWFPDPANLIYDFASPDLHIRGRHLEYLRSTGSSAWRYEIMNVDWHNPGFAFTPDTVELGFNPTFVLGRSNLAQSYSVWRVDGEPSDPHEVRREKTFDDGVPFAPGSTYVQWENSLGDGLKGYSMLPSINKAAFDSSIVGTSAEFTYDILNSEVTFNEPELYVLGGALSGNTKIGYFTAWPFLGAANVPAEAYAASLALSPNTYNSGMAMDRVWVSVYRPGGLKKWQLITVEQV